MTVLIVILNEAKCSKESQILRSAWDDRQEEYITLAQNDIKLNNRIKIANLITKSRSNKARAMMPGLADENFLVAKLFDYDAFDLVYEFIGIVAVDFHLDGL